LSFVAYVLVMGQITAQGSINVYGWLFLGLLIAACRHAAPRPVARPLPARPPRFWRETPGALAPREGKGRQ